MDSARADLAHPQKLPCTFELEVPGLGVLEGNPGENVWLRTPIILLFWSMLYPGSRSLDKSGNPHRSPTMAGPDAVYRVSFWGLKQQTNRGCPVVLLSCSNQPERTRLGTSRLVTLDLPSALFERVMNALKADPRTVDLRSLAPHFYNLSERILELFEEEEMVDILSDVCAPHHLCI